MSSAMDPPIPVTLAVITASTRRGRFGPVVAGWFTALLAGRDDVTVDTVDLADTRLPEVLGAFGEQPGPEIEALRPRLAAAEAFVVVTPEYNHSFPASLKILIDSYHDEWKAKPVGFVSYGGMAGGLRAVEQLRPVFAEVHATTVRDTVSFHGFWDVFGPDGRPVDDAACTAAAKTMTDQLLWWTHALRDARARHPYAG